LNPEKNTVSKIISILELILLLFIVIGLPIYIYFYHHEWIEYFSSVDNINNFLAKYKAESMLIYFGMQILQVVISVIPGQAVQFVAGYAFPFWIGYLLAVAGVVVGTVMSYFLARILGKKAIYLIFGEKKIQKFVDKLNSKRAFILIFIIFLVPGIPKDLFSYAIGLSEMKFMPFLLTSVVARTPAMMCSVAMGCATKTGSYVLLAILVVFLVITCILGVIFHERLARRVDQLYVRLTSK